MNRSRMAGFHVIVLFAAFAIPTGIAMAGAGMEVDTNRYGSDYRGFDAVSAEQCQAACVGEITCKAWTWVKPGVQGPQAKCWLKNAVPAASANACCISGVSGKALLSTPDLRNESSLSSLSNPQQENELATSTYRALLTEEGAESLVAAGVIRPEVYTINKQSPTGYVFRAGTAVAIHGRGFGTSGKLRLLGSFSKTPEFQINDWRPSVIYARLPDRLGFEKLDDVRLEIQPSGLQPITISGVRYESRSPHIFGP